MSHDTVRAFGRLPDGRVVQAHRIRSATGLELTLLDLGATIQSLCVPSPGGGTTDVVLGFDHLEDYRRDPNFIGCTVGRVANRIADGEFTLDGQTWRLPKNLGRHHLHGGPGGFHRALWAVEPLPGGGGLRCRHVSPDGEGGYPGQLDVTVMVLLEGNTVALAYEAVTSAATPVNLTNHSYFNLAGSGDTRHHRLRVDADAWTPTHGERLPTGEIRSVNGTPLDLRTMRMLGDLAVDGVPGCDENFVLRGDAGRLRVAACLEDPVSGRALEVATTQPGLQVYTGRALDGLTTGKGGWRHGPGAGVCLETQHFPDAVHHPGFPDVILRPGAVYRHRTEYRFRA